MDTASTIDFEFLFPFPLLLKQLIIKILRMIRLGKKEPALSQQTQVLDSEGICFLCEGVLQVILKKLLIVF